MPSSLASSLHTDASLEPEDFIDSRFPSRPVSYHESDVPIFSQQDYPWHLQPLPGFPTPHVQSVKGTHGDLLVPSALIPDTSSIQGHLNFQPTDRRDKGGPFTPCQLSGSLPAALDLCHDFRPVIQRTDSTSSLEMTRKAARASRFRPTRAAIAPPQMDAGVKKTRKGQLWLSSSQRNSLALSPYGSNVEASPDAKWHIHAPAKDAVKCNDGPLSSEDEDSHYIPRNEAKELPFACPFFRRWPTRYVDCVNRKLTRIQDVKRHLYRRHSQSPFYCPTCFRQFPSPNPRDEHIREGSCTPAIASSKCIDAISAEVRNSLKHYFTQKVSPMEKWYGMWDLIFPGEKPPESPYFGGMVSETLSMLRDLCKNESQLFIPDTVIFSPTKPITKEDLQTMMIQMVDRVHDHFKGGLPQTRDSTSGGLVSRTGRMVERSSVNGEPGPLLGGELMGDELTSAFGIWGAPFPGIPPPTSSTAGRPDSGPSSCFDSSELFDESLFTGQNWMTPPSVNQLLNGFQ
ncbi:hypothetical protein NQ176_g1972 [Zarea fungicola]|uniref:Uncharacterized protein n=1 Tax=Zarea fungicola TaxID=93591 RepID=A0ACC1NQG7_9HYPO|nr:hypothetical protein NQ176_g1972 [Lecanicillium fungicola]